MSTYQWTDIEMAIANALNPDKELTTGEIDKAIELNLRFGLNVPHLVAILQNMRSAGFVEVVDGARYRLTARGRASTAKPGFGLAGFTEVTVK